MRLRTRFAFAGPRRPAAGCVRDGRACGVVAPESHSKWLCTLVRPCVRPHRTTGNNLATTPSVRMESSENVLAEYFLSNAMKAVVEHGHMALVQRIHSLHPERLNVRLLPIAAKKGNLEMFQWLLTHRTDDLCVPEALRSTKSIASLSCCLREPYDQVIRHDQLHIAMWLLTNGFQPPDHLHTTIGDAAAARGDLEMVQWLHTNAIPHGFTSDAIDLAITTWSRFTSQAVHYAVLGGYDDIHELLRVSGVIDCYEVEDLGNWAHDAAKHGRLDLVQSARYRHVHHNAALESAMSHGHLHVVQWICKNNTIAPHVGFATSKGHLHILQWLHDHPEEMKEPTNWTRAMDSAASCGQLHVVQRLHETCGDSPQICTSNAMVNAAMNGHLAVVQWLHENRTEGYTVNAMDLAARNNHMEIVQWLHVHRTEGCSTRAMTDAANEGHLEMVIWLHEHRTEGYAPETFLYALQHAPLSVLKWLRLNRHEGWTASRVIHRAVIIGDLATLQFLHEQRTTEGNIRSRVWPFVHRPMAPQKLPR